MGSFMLLNSWRKSRLLRFQWLLLLPVSVFFFFSTRVLRSLLISAALIAIIALVSPTKLPALRFASTHYWCFLVARISGASIFPEPM